MKKIALAVLVIIMSASVLGCAAASATDVPKIMPSETDYRAELDINSPEGLAQESSDIYKDLLNKDITVEDGFDRLLDISCEQAATSMLEYEKEFGDQIAATIDYFKSEDDSILRYDFAQTEYGDDDNTASIKRIQVQENGKKYYFKQDFVKEDGVWKIKGDNVENDFELKQRFLFWFI